LFRLKKALSFMRGTYIARPSVPTRVNRRTNLYFL